MRCIARAPRRGHGVGACGVGGRGRCRRAAGRTLLRQRPDLRLLVTTITPTGSARVRALWGDRVEHVYLPYDLPGAVKRFLAHYRPQLAIDRRNRAVAEPAVLLPRPAAFPPTSSTRACRNARCAAIAPCRPLVGRALRTLRKVAAQSRRDGERFVRLGADRDAVVVTGNLKFDIADRSALAGIGGHVRPACGRTPGLDRRQHARRGGSRGDRDPPAAARALAGPAAVVGAAASRTLPPGGAGLRRCRLARRHAQAHALAGPRRRRVRDRHAGRTDGFLCLRRCRLRRRQPAGHRWPQPARTGSGRHGGGDRAAPAQLQRHRPVVACGAMPCAWPTMPMASARRSKACWPMAIGAPRWPLPGSGWSNRGAGRWRARWP